MRSKNIRRFLLTWVCFSLMACQNQAAPAATAAPVFESATATLTIPPAPTQTSTALPAPTNTAIPLPTLSPTALPVLRTTPPTLMLHRSNAKFDAVQFLGEMIEIIQENNLRVITYSDIQENPAITVAEQGKLFIITIDDIYLRYPMHESIKEMITLLQGAGYPAVLGIITEGDYAYPETAAKLKELSDQGWEIASHTDNHRNLGQMERVSPRAIYLEINDSMEKIEAAVGIRPITLILPEGQMVNDGKQLRRANLTWIVGINGGNQYDSSRDLLYVGRDGPAENAAETFKKMLKRFLP
jgi:peptidoglycan/xylan/chitin deacetylase (PgdA/CDA1 family)